MFGEAFHKQNQTVNDTGVSSTIIFLAEKFFFKINSFQFNIIAGKNDFPFLQNVDCVDTKSLPVDYINTADFVVVNCA